MDGPGEDKTAARGTPRRATIRTVAADAGVSVAAVSKVLRNAYGVSEALRARVQASIERLGYRPLAAARAMRGQTYTIGVLLPDFVNPFFADILAGINAALERSQYQPLIGISQSLATVQDELINAFIDRQMDGLILVGPRLHTADVAAVARRIPTVAVGYHARDEEGFDTVNDHDRLGAELVVDHLAGAGFRHIAFVSLRLPAATQTEVTIEREIGFKTALARHGLGKHGLGQHGFGRHPRIVQVDQTPREVRTAVRHLLQGERRPDALFCWTDFVALEALSVARELGLRVPEDVAVVGYDNTRYCDLAQNALTSVDQSGQLLGLQSARLLIERIDGRAKAEHLVVTPRLVVRASSQPARQRPLAQPDG